MALPVCFQIVDEATQYFYTTVVKILHRVGVHRVTIFSIVVATVSPPLRIMRKKQWNKATATQETLETRSSGPFNIVHGITC